MTVTNLEKPPKSKKGQLETRGKVTTNPPSANNGSIPSSEKKSDQKRKSVTKSAVGKAESATKSAAGKTVAPSSSRKQSGKADSRNLDEQTKAAAKVAPKKTVAKVRAKKTVSRPNNNIKTTAAASSSKSTAIKDSTQSKSKKVLAKKKNTVANSKSSKSVKKLNEKPKKVVSSSTSKSSRYPSPPLKMLSPVEHPLERLTPVELPLPPVEPPSPVPQKKKRKFEGRVSQPAKKKVSERMANKPSVPLEKVSSKRSVKVKVEPLQPVLTKPPKTSERHASSSNIKREHSDKAKEEGKTSSTASDRSAKQTARGTVSRKSLSPKRKKPLSSSNKRSRSPSRRKKSPATRTRKRSRSPVRSRRSRSPLQNRKSSRARQSRLSPRIKSSSPNLRVSSRRRSRSRKRSRSPLSRASQRKRFTSRSPSYKRRTDDRGSRNYSSASSHRSRRDRKGGSKAEGSRWSRRSRDRSREKDRSRFRRRSRDRPVKSRSRSRNRKSRERRRQPSKSKTNSRFEDKESERRFPLKIESIGIDRSRNMRRNRVPFERPGDRPSYIPFASRFSDGPGRGGAFSDKRSQSKSILSSTPSSPIRKEKTEEEFIREEEEELVKVEKKWEEEEKKADLEYVNSEIARSLKRLSKTVEGRTPTPSPESESDDDSFNYRQSSVASLALSMMAGMDDRVVERGPRRAFHTGPAVTGRTMPFQQIRNVPFQQANPIMNRQMSIPASRAPVNNTALAAVNNLRAGLAKRVGVAMPNGGLSTTPGGATTNIGGAVMASGNRGGMINNRGAIQRNPARGSTNRPGGITNNRGAGPINHRGGFANNRRGGLGNNRRGGLSNNSDIGFSNNRRGGLNNTRGNYINPSRGINSGRGRGFNNNRGRGFSSNRGNYTNNVGFNNRAVGPNNNFRRGFDSNRSHGQPNRGGFSNYNLGQGQMIKPEMGLHQGTDMQKNIRGEPVGRGQISPSNRGMLTGRGENFRGGRFPTNRSGGINNRTGRGRFGRNQFNNRGRGQLVNPNIDSRLQHGNDSPGRRGGFQGPTTMPTRPFQSNPGRDFSQEQRRGFDGNRGRRGLSNENIPGGLVENNRGRGFVPNNRVSFVNNGRGQFDPQRTSRFQQVNNPPQQMLPGNFRGRDPMQGENRQPGRGRGQPGRGGALLPAWYKDADPQKPKAYIHPSRRNMVPIDVPNSSKEFRRPSGSHQSYQGVERQLPLQMPPPKTVDGFPNRRNQLRTPPARSVNIPPYPGVKPAQNQFPKEKVVDCVYKFIQDHGPKSDTDQWKWKGVLFSELVTHLKQEFVFITPQALFEENWNQFFHNMTRVRDVECIDVLAEGPSMRRKAAGLQIALAEAQKVVLEHLRSSEPKDEQQIVDWKGVELDALKAHFKPKFDFQHFGFKKFKMFLEGIRPCEVITDNDKSYVRLKLEAKPKTAFKPQNVEERALKIMRERTRDPWTLKQRMISQFADGVVKEKVSLRDPYTAGFLKIPCKGLQCTHRQAFDLEIFLRMLRPKKKPLCPICQKLVSESTVWVDGFWLAVCKRWAAKDPESCMLHLDGKVSLESGEEFDPAPEPPSSTAPPQKIPKAEPPAALKIEEQPQYIQHHYKKKQEFIKFRVNFSKLKDIVNTDGEDQALKHLPVSHSRPASADKPPIMSRTLKRGRTQRTEEEYKIGLTTSDFKKTNEWTQRDGHKHDKPPALKKQRRSPSYDLAAEYNDIFGNDEKPLDNPPESSGFLPTRPFFDKPEAPNSQKFSDFTATSVQESRPYVDTRIQQPSQPQIGNYPRSPIRDTRLGDTRLRGSAPSNEQSNPTNYQPNGLIRDSNRYSYQSRPTTPSPARYNQNAYSLHSKHDQQEKIRNEPMHIQNPFPQNIQSGNYLQNPFNRSKNLRFTNPEPTQLRSFDSRAPPSLPRDGDPSANIGPKIRPQNQGEALRSSSRPNITEVNKGLPQPHNVRRDCDGSTKPSR